MQHATTMLVTGGAGFIGSNYIRHVLVNTGFAGRIINLDALTYAGNRYNLSDIESNQRFAGRYIFSHTDICNFQALQAVFEQYQPDSVVHFAAESHVDRSILGPRAFIETNILGTFNLLECARAMAKPPRFHHVSTDEVFGSLGESGFFSETTAYDPRSPYSASKAASDHLVRSYYHTYGLPVTISNCSNNYGSYHFPEKLIPVMLLNMLEKKPLPVYGDGANIRDWLFVSDHADAVWRIVERGRLGETYCVGGENEWQNLRLVKTLCGIVAQELARRTWPLASASAWKTCPSGDDLLALITFVKDRPGHDQRYAIDCSKIKQELGWKQSCDFEQGLKLTVAWYLDHPEWVDQVRSGAYTSWVARNYGER